VERTSDAFVLARPGTATGRCLRPPWLWSRSPQRLGHARVSTTLNVYATPSPGARCTELGSVAAHSWCCPTSVHQIPTP